MIFEFPNGVEGHVVSAAKYNEFLSLQSALRLPSPVNDLVVARARLSFAERLRVLFFGELYVVWLSPVLQRVVLPQFFLRRADVRGVHHRPR